MDLGRWVGRKERKEGRKGERNEGRKKGRKERKEGGKEEGRKKRDFSGGLVVKRVQGVLVQTPVG